jgi:hypothetical protein
MLINDILIKTGVITEIARGNQSDIQWFKGISSSDIIVTYILPLLFFLAISVYLKLRYDKKKARDEITMSAFLRH